MEPDPHELDALVRSLLDVSAAPRSPESELRLRQLCGEYGRRVSQRTLAAAADEFQGQSQPLIDAVIAMAALDFSHRTAITGHSATIDGIATGLNMLAEELRSRLEEERSLRARLLHKDRLAAVGQLAAGVAHEVNNPAAYVLANLDLVTRQVAKLRSHAAAVSEAVAAGDERRQLELAKTALPPGKLDDVARFLSECVDGMRRIVSVVGDLKTFSRSESQDETLDVNELVRVAARMLEKTISYRAQLRLELEPLPATRGNRSRLTQAVTNLLLNAAQAIAEGNPGANYVRLATAVAGQQMHVVVEDTGVGMTADVQRHLFEPFFTTKPVGEGTGLGLSLTHEIISQHGGTIAVRSEPGRGTTFTLSLPLRLAGRPRPRLPAPAAPQVAQVEQVKVLLVDDEPLVLRAYHRQLRSSFDVTATTSGGEAIELIRRNAYDVVVCDLMMPDVDGPAVYEAAIAHQPELAKRFVFVSGGAFTERTRRFAAELGDALLDKPIDLAVLAERIALLAARSRTGS